MEGQGILSNLRTRMKRIVNPVLNSLGIYNTSLNIKPITSSINKSISYANTVIKGRDDYPPNARSTIAQYGNDNIKSIEVIRQPVQSFIPKIFNALTFGQFQKKLDEQPYDKMYHLRMVITTDSDKKIQIEKNEVINISTSITAHSKQEGQDVPITKQVNLNQLLEGAKWILGSKMYSYHPFTNNCQDFIIAILEGSNLLNETLKNFIKQDVSELATINPYLSKIASGITSLGGKFNEIIHGTGIHVSHNETHKVQSVIFDKDKWTTIKAKKWLKDNDYISPKVDITNNFRRFRQLDPNDFPKPQWRYTTHRIPSGIELIIVYKNNDGIKSIKGMGIKKNKIVLSDSDSDSDSDYCPKKSTKKSTMKGKGEMIHIDIGSHNASNRSKSNMKGGALEHVPFMDADYRLQDYSAPMKTFQPLDMKLKTNNALLNNLSKQDLIELKHLLGLAENKVSQKLDVGKITKSRVKKEVKDTKKLKPRNIKTRGSTESKKAVLSKYMDI